MPVEVTIVTPAFNEEQNLLALHARLRDTFDSAGLAWEWIVVDDHSHDGTFQAIEKLAASDSRVLGLRFSRNSGSHTAISCGLRHARGRCAVVMAADLQDPPEVILRLLEEWRLGAQTVWAARQSRPGEKPRDLFFSKMYYFLMRKFVGMRDMPAEGADFFLLDRVVIDALSRFQERNISLFALIHWMGFRQKVVSYVKQARVHGVSGWGVWKKVKLLVDSVLPFSYVPIRIMSASGAVISVLGFLYGVVVLVNAFFHDAPVHGWSSLMFVILVLGGMQMLTLGILGEYLWRAYDESRRRPGYMIENSCGRYQPQADGTGGSDADCGIKTGQACIPERGTDRS